MQAADGGMDRIEAPYTVIATGPGGVQVSGPSLSTARAGNGASTVPETEGLADGFQRGTRQVPVALVRRVADAAARVYPLQQES